MGTAALPPDPAPKDRFTSLDTLAVVHELRSLGRARVDKAFDGAEGGWSVLLRGRDTGRQELVLFPGRYAAVLPAGVSHAEEFSPIAREIRRVFTGSALRSVAEPGAERYLELRFGRSAEPEELILALELFGAGNLILARGGRILAASKPRRWAHRNVRAGAPYSRPLSRADPWTLSLGQIESELGRSRTDLASTLAARLALGGPVAEEVIARGDWEGAEPAASVAARVAPRLHAILSELVAEVGERPRGFLVQRRDVILDATPYHSRRWEEAADVEVIERPSFSEAAAEFFRTVIPRSSTPEDALAAERRKQLARLVERQQAAVEELGAAAKERKADAEAVLSHYAAVEAALATAVKSDPRPGSVLVDLGGRRVAIAVESTPRKIAQTLYEESKRLAKKLEGAAVALKETEVRLAEPVESVARTPRAPARRPSKTRWFERHRWFISSEGAIVVAGRDAGSNDALVRRNLKEGDIYIHADLQGAASVVVKRPTSPASVTEVTLREAAQWAVAFSKAWRAGLASASAFWATPDQVSKSSASGEFVARGAFVIRGTKHFVHDVPLELALGKIRYEGEERWVLAPLSAIAARGSAVVLLTPGEERDRAAREVELARDLGIPRSVLQSLLPAGGLSVRRP
jgi:predicted ribosome quality control (RQC) complex YloA/Tae2 family protein